MPFNPRSPLYKMEAKNPLPVRENPERGPIGSLPLPEPEPVHMKSPMKVAHDGYQTLESAAARPAHEAGPRYDPDNPTRYGRFP